MLDITTETKDTKSQKNRDDFTQKDKDTLAKRVGYKCSNPGCRAVTIGPNTDISKSTSIGVAAHIKAAAPGGPRYDVTQTSEQRSSIENGIHLCEKDARIIDKDPDKYPVELLLEWKRKAEEKSANELTKADITLEIGELTEKDLEEIIIVLATETKVVGDKLAKFTDLKRDMNEKNKLNNMDKEYYNDIIIKQYYKYFDLIRKFLKNPDNYVIQEQYEAITLELNEYIFKMKKEYTSIVEFSEIIDKIYLDIVMKPNSNLKNAKNRKLLKALLLFMYEECDLGENV